MRQDLVYKITNRIIDNIDDHDIEYISDNWSESPHGKRAEDKVINYYMSVWRKHHKMTVKEQNACREQVRLHIADQLAVPL